MADQTNPWDSAPATDSAAQAADAWVAPLLPRRPTAAAPTGCTARPRRSRNRSTSWTRSIKR